MIVDFSADRLFRSGLLRSLIEALPLPVFLVGVRWVQPTVSADWRAPYFASTAVAIATTIWVVMRHETLHRIYLGLNLYFLSGSIGLALRWAWLNETYGRIEATGMLLWIVAVGVVSTGWSERGFLAGALGTPRAIKQESLYLLLAALCATAFSWNFRGDSLLSAYIPFIFLFTAHALLRAQAGRRSRNSPA